MSWIDFDTTVPAVSVWQGIAVSPGFEGRGRELAARLGCTVKTVDGDPVEFVEREKPEIFLTDDLEAAARVAEKFRTGLLRCDDVDLDVGARLLVMKTAAYGGRVLQEWTCPAARPQVAVLASPR